MAMTMMNDDEFFVENVRRKMEMALLLSRVVEGTLPDILAAYTPLLAPIIPAVIGFENVQTGLGFGFGLALVYAVIVECLGLATTITASQFRAWNLAHQPPTGSPQMAGERHLGGWQKAPFKMAVGMVVFYLVIVLGVNVALDSGTILQKAIKGAASLLSVIGAVTWALRSEQAKRVAEAQAVKADEGRAEHERREDEREEREKEQERAHQWKMDAERLQFEHEERMRKIEEESRRKMEKIRADGLRQASARAEQSPESGRTVAGDAPGVSGGAAESHRRWSDVSPDDYGWLADAPVGEVVKKYRLTGKDPERLARTWKAYARKALKRSEA